MMNLKLIAPLIFALFISCSNEIEINDEWKDITCIIGVLNQNDSVHYIRIQRGYLGKGDMESTHDYDSIYYSENINVKIERWKDDELIESFNLYKTNPNEIIKDSGLFSYKNAFVFKTSHTIYPDSKYKLSIYIPSLNKTIEASTYLIDDFELDEETYYLFNNNINFSFNSMFSVGWITPYDAKVFYSKLLIHYIEVINYDSTYKSIIWTMNKSLSNSVLGGEHIKFYLPKSDFYKFVGSKLKELPGYDDYRVITGIDLLFNVSTEELNTYIELSNPTTGLLQDLPVYTNIDNAYGIFSSRYTKLFRGGTLDKKSKDSLACGVYTKHLNFLDFFDNLHRCE
ncbi:MAG: DUF4249 family protein [Chlorobi bacterium]|nr:DUF4249 family protein [Chlorobiota bacterium]